MAVLAWIFYFYLFVISLYAIFSAAISLQRFKPEKVDAKKKQRVLVMVPCKGIDFTLNQNLRSLKNQTYGKYDIVAIVDNERDSAVRDIKRVGIKMLIADARFGGGSGKVNALSTAISRFRNYDIYVIADSDIIVNKDWLENLSLRFPMGK